MINTTELHIVFIIYSTLTTLFILYEDKHYKLFKLFTRYEWILSFIFILVWSLYILQFNAFGYFNNKPEDLIQFKKATHHAILALIISIFAYLELIVPVFWLVLIVSFLI